jgi:hypothetical protein
MPNNVRITAGLVLLLLSLAACAALDSGSSLPLKHPSAADMGMSVTNCTDCHEARSEGLAFGDFVHTPTWTSTHRYQAYQQEPVCSTCHQTSFCNSCHVSGVELKPSERNKLETNRQMPHRGDYLSRHRIDGRIDPSSCFRCHGNPKAAQTCAPCHG